MVELTWFNREGLSEFYSKNYKEDGDLKPDTTPLGQGSFASVFKGAEAGGSAETVLRVVSAKVGSLGDSCFDKEVKAVRAFLKLMDESDTPVTGQIVMLNVNKQPPGMCNIYGYLIDNINGVRRIFTVMPLARPLMEIIEDQLQAAQSGGEGVSRDTSQLVKWMSQVAVALKYMHKKGVFWRDCKLDNIVIVDGDAKIIDISSGVCTVGYASHEQLVKLDLNPESINDADSQKITDKLEQVLLDEPDHQTWQTQDVFALSIVVVEFLTYGMFTYPYQNHEVPGYAHLLLYELEVYNLLLHELKSMYDVSSLMGRLDRKIKHWKALIPDAISPTSQSIRDLTLWPLAVGEFSRDRRLFDLWAALAFWDHVDHQFGFIGHWTEWLFDFDKHAQGDAAPTLPAPTQDAPASTSEASEQATETADKVPMAVWRQRADDVSADVSAIKARLQLRSERIDHFEDDHTARVVKRLSSLTHRMDVLNNSLSTFWGANGSPVKGSALPTVKIVYSTADKVSEVVGNRKENAFPPGAAGAGGKLVEVRLRIRMPGPEKRAALLEALGRAPDTSGSSKA